MKANFGKKELRMEQNRFHEGDYEDMIRNRKKKLGEAEGAINGVLENYDGGLIAIIQIEEDENGLPAGKSLLITGTSNLKGSMALVKGFQESKDEFLQHMVESAKGDPKALKAILKEVLDDVKKKIEED